MNTHKQRLDAFGALYVKDVLSKELCVFLTHCLMRAPFYCGGVRADTQVQGGVGLLEHELLFDTAQERIWPAIEQVLEEELLPTYSYARLYTNGNELVRHKDRPACEISITVQLARSHHYSWPIYMGEHRFDLAEGDGVIYKGCDVEHWRNVCDAPNNYYSGQAFFHFVRKNGPHAGHATDLLVSREKMGWSRDLEVYKRNRHDILENK